jgi:hypothetical protein
VALVHPFTLKVSKQARLRRSPRSLCMYPSSPPTILYTPPNTYDKSAKLAGSLGHCWWPLFIHVGHRLSHSNSNQQPPTPWALLPPKFRFKNFNPLELPSLGRSLSKDGRQGPGYSSPGRAILLLYSNYCIKDKVHHCSAQRSCPH